MHIASGLKIYNIEIRLHTPIRNLKYFSQKLHLAVCEWTHPLNYSL
jgi:hypothetical protein